MSQPIRVSVVGAAGRMGRETVKAVTADPGMELVSVIGHSRIGTPIGDLIPGLVAGANLLLQDDLAAALQSAPADVVVDYSPHSVTVSNAISAIANGASPIIGSTGLSKEDIETIAQASRDQGVPALLIPNFAIGAVLMMKFSEVASKWFPDAEIIELHHEKKLDAPSGTALLTAELIGRARTATPTPKPEHVIVKAEGALGGMVHGVPVHSIRLPGLLAHQQVMFGSLGETLTIRHDSSDRAGFMPGVKLAIREVKSLNGLVIGLDKLLFKNGL